MTIKFMYITRIKHLKFLIKKCNVYIIFIFLLSLTNQSYASESFTLFNHDKEMYLHPHKSYQHLLSLQPLLSEQTDEQRLLWFQQKATVEYLLLKPKAFTLSVISARKLLTRHSSETIKAKLIFYSGLIAQQSNEYAKAFTLFSEAMSLTQGKDTLLFVEIKKALLFNQHFTQLFDDTLNDLQLAYIEAFSSKDDFVIALINQTYGDLYRYTGELDIALDYYLKAYETYEQFNYIKHLEQTLYSIMLTYRDNKNTAEALENLKYYEKTTLKHRNAYQDFLILYGYATTLSEQNKVNDFKPAVINAEVTKEQYVNITAPNCIDAISYINDALLLKGSLPFIAELLKRKTFCLTLLAEYEQAQRTLTKVNLLYDDIPELKNTYWQLETLRLAGHLAYVQKKYPQSLDWFDNYYEKLLSEQKKKFDFRFSNKEKELTIERNEIELSLIDQQYRNKTITKKLEYFEALELRYITAFIIFICLVVICLIIHKKSTSRKLLSLTIKDDLTGLYNRNYILSLWRKLLSNHSGKRKMSVLLIEIDNIKLLNENYGYVIKDNIVCQIVEVMNTCLRTEDTIGRVDSEQFICILPRIDEMLTMKIAERLVSLVNHSDFVINGDDIIKMTLSIGVRSIQPSSTSDVNTLYKELAQALSRAKNSGKNQTVIFRERPVFS